MSSDTRTRLAQLSETEMKIIRYINILPRPVYFREILYFHYDYFSWSDDNPPTAFHQRHLLHILNNMIKRELLSLSPIDMAGLENMGFEATHRGSQSEFWQDARENGMGALLAASLGMHMMEPRQGLFDRLEFPDGAWDSMFVIVDDETLKAWEIQQLEIEQSQELEEEDES